MAQMLDFLSVFLMPLVIFYVVGYGICAKRPVFEDFLVGGKKGFQIIVEIAPTIVGLLVAVGVLRNSGALDIISDLLTPVADFCKLPAELIPLSIIKMFSASGSNGLLFDIFKEFGTDSYIGMSASILLSCTETLLYTISLYYMSIGVKKARWTVAVGCLLAGGSLAISTVLARFLC